MRRIIVGLSVVLTGAFVVAPIANAAEWVNTTQLIDQVNASLQPVNIELDNSAAKEFDSQVNSAIDDATTEAQEIPIAQYVQPGAALEAVTVADKPLPNYQYREDVVSQIMAATPGPVLHRVPGSWFNAPAVPEESRVAEAAGNSIYGPGTPIFVNGKVMCTITATGVDNQGRKVGITAGHCGHPGDAVRSADSYWVGDTGRVVANGMNDYSVIELGPNAEITNTYNGVTVTDLGGSADSGQFICKSGSATGRTCGPVIDPEPDVMMSQVCAMPGDSGAPVVSGQRLVGMVSGGMLPYRELACVTPLQGPFFMPTVSLKMDTVLAELNQSGGPGAGFQLTQ